MAEAKSRERWMHTSQLLSLIANVNRDPRKGEPFSPSDFNPYAPKRKPMGGGLGAFKALVRKHRQQVGLN